MVDPRVEKLARLVVEHSVGVKPQEKVMIHGSYTAFPLIREIYKECLLNDAYPQIMADLDTSYTFFKYAKDHQLSFVSPFERFVTENVDVRIRVHCDPDPRRLSNIKPSKLRTMMAARKELSDIHRRREAEGKLRWTVIPFPISAQAQDASMSLEEYEDFVYRSCLVDKEDPIMEWRRIYESQAKLCDFLNKASEVRFVGEDTDLTLNVKGRKWINCGGKENMPDGEIYTGPVENSAEGTIRFTYPGIYMGREVEDITLVFKAGEVVEVKAAKGEDLLQQLLQIDGANRIGEIAIGTNYGISRFTKNMLFDEKMGGTIHMALGSSYPDSGGQNKSSVHWDILKDMKHNGQIYVDGRLFYKNGNFSA